MAKGARPAQMAAAQVWRFPASAAAAPRAEAEAWLVLQGSQCLPWPPSLLPLPQQQTTPSTWAKGGYEEKEEGRKERRPAGAAGEEVRGHALHHTRLPR